MNSVIIGNDKKALKDELLLELLEKLNKAIENKDELSIMVFSTKIEKLGYKFVKQTQQ